MPQHASGWGDSTDPPSRSCTWTSPEMTATPRRTLSTLGAQLTPRDERWILLHVPAKGAQGCSGGPQAARANRLNLCICQPRNYYFPFFVKIFTSVWGGWEERSCPPGNPFHDKLPSCTNPGCAKLVQLSQDFFFKKKKKDEKGCVSV